MCHFHFFFLNIFFIKCNIEKQCKNKIKAPNTQSKYYQRKIKTIDKQLYFKMEYEQKTQKKIAGMI